MITETVQRWTERRESRRPAGELIRTSAYDVVECPDDATPRAFVERHHYSGAWVAARFRFLLYQRGELAGAAVFSVTPSVAAHRRVFPTLKLEQAVATTWLRRWRAALTRPVRHPGNLRYRIGCLDRRRQREVMTSPALPYVKMADLDSPT